MPEKMMCFRVFEISRGMSLLVRLQILTSLIFFFNLFVKSMTNPFLNDSNMQIFLSIQFITNLPRFYSGYLAWQWFQDDNVQTRVKLKRSFLIWFLIDLMALFNKTIVNHYLFEGKSFVAYKYEKRYNLPAYHPRGFPIKLKPTNLEEMILSIEKIEKTKVFLRAAIWLPLKFYFYLAAIRFCS